MTRPEARNPQRSPFLAVAALFACVVTGPAPAQSTAPELPEAKQTTLGLYLTAREAYERWRAEPERIKLLDVRTTEEYLYIGHAPMAWNVPLLAQTYRWDTDKQMFSMAPNPDFIAQVREFADPIDTILVMCRSGGRSALAVNQLAEAGFRQVYNITDGMEGDAVQDPESVFRGQRLRNGWKNAGNPWTYEPAPELMRFVSNPTEAANEH